jgi:hypothetical protein
LRGGRQKPPTFFHEHDGGKESSKETTVSIYDVIYKKQVLSWNQSDRTGKPSCIVMTR